ncbi:MAG: hypothetical protein AAB472_02585 [Patescibacteria group bacterium]
MSTSAFPDAPKSLENDRTPPDERAEHARVVFDACTEVINEVIQKAEAAAVQNKVTARFLARDAEGIVKEISRDEFLRQSIADCVVAVAPYDPVLAPAMVGKDPHTI